LIAPARIARTRSVMRRGPENAHNKRVVKRSPPMFFILLLLSAHAAAAPTSESCSNPPAGRQNRPIAADDVPPIVWAASSGDLEVLRHALDCGADPNRQYGFSGWLPLVEAARNGRIDAAKLLLERGARVEAEGAGLAGSRGVTPLFAAAAHGQYRMVELLLAAGADPNARDREMNDEMDAPLQHTPLTKAFSIRYADDAGMRLRTIEALIRGGADVNAPGDKGCTPLIELAGHQFDQHDAPALEIELAKTLIAAGADLGWQAEPALVRAAAHGKQKLAVFVLDELARRSEAEYAELVESSVEMLLHTAAAGKSIGLIEELLRRAPQGPQVLAGLQETAERLKWREGAERLTFLQRGGK